MTLGDGALWLVVALVVVVGGTVAALQAAADRRRREALLLWSADRSVPAWVRRVTAGTPRAVRVHLRRRPDAGRAPAPTLGDVVSPSVAALGPVLLVLLAEAYPELEASDGFVPLQRGLRDTEDRIAAGRRPYDADVRALDTRVEVVPSNVAASAAGIGRAEYLAVSDPAVRARPDVVF